jgi:N-methylhydantoinase A/oxoprolinase/acetone carboxylase beta subunit
MRIGIGIDTGGTFTDAVAYDFDAERVLFSCKAQTTREDLSLGIGSALDGIPADLVHQAEIVSLSTTLATNACVENKGGRARLLFIGVDPWVVDWVGRDAGLPDAKEMFFLEARCNSRGEIVEEPDWNRLLSEAGPWIAGAAAVGIVELDAMDDNAVLEKRARDLVVREFGLPTICGHELFSDLDSIRRGASVLLNARLVPLITDFLAAVRSAMERRAIRAPVVIVRSDGSLMSDAFAVRRPVETLLCGPAASVMGGLALAKEPDCLIVDMGGTTTDIAIVKEGSPVKAGEGVRIGQWSTYVRGLFVDTFGLGGDSAVRVDGNGRMTLEPRRLIPLSVAAARWPSIAAHLAGIVHAGKTHPLPVHESFCLVRRIAEGSGYDERETRFCRALENGPLGLVEAAEAAGTDAYNLDVGRLEDEGVVIRCGLTPTDIMHCRGDFSRFDAAAARLGAEYIASCLGITVDDLCDLVYDTVKRRLYSNIVRVLMEDQDPRLRESGPNQAIDSLVRRSWEAARNSDERRFFSFRFHTPAALVGLGAPVHIFLPDVARALGTRCVIPADAGVANAVGAVVGNIRATCDIEIKPQYSIDGVSGFIVFGAASNSHVAGQDEAVSIGEREAREAARAEAMRRGASGHIALTSRVVHHAAPSRNGKDILIGIRVTATAIGRIAV